MAFLSILQPRRASSPNPDPRCMEPLASQTCLGEITTVGTAAAGKGF
jgi:hypothetical protein